MGADYPHAAGAQPAIACCAAFAGMALRPDPAAGITDPRHAYVVMVDAPDVATSADLAQSAANDVATVIGTPWRAELVIRTASSARDASSACGQVPMCEMVRIHQRQSPGSSEESQLRLVTETARGDRHRPVNRVIPCGIRPSRRHAYSRCRAALADDIAQELRRHDDSEHIRRRAR